MTHDRSLLGTADVTDDELARVAAVSLGTAPRSTRVLTSRAEVVPYDVPALTTAGRYWVSGTAEVDGEQRAYRVFVKHVQAWSRSPLFAEVPPEVQEVAAAGLPWRTEPLAYRSDLGERLPAGLRMPRVLAVHDLDELSAAVWLAEVDVRSEVWSLATYAEAAGLVGRLAASPRVAERADVGRFPFDVRDYVDGRLAHQVVPMLHSDIWEHPLVRGSFDADLRERLVAASERVDAVADELLTLPHATSHGDACPNNLLREQGAEGFVLIDYGFWGRMPIGFDLGQLLVGDVQVGRRTAADLAEVEDTIVPAYVEGLRAEGDETPAAVVRRAHALCLLLFTGLSTLPWEHLGRPPSPDLEALARDRAAIARLTLDLVDATEPAAPTT